MAIQKIKASSQIDNTLVSYTATVVGFSGTPSCNTSYVKVGKLVTVFYSLNGTSNAASTTFTLPSTPDTTAFPHYEAAIGLTLSNGGVINQGRAYHETTNVVRLTGTGTAIATTGNKQLRGVFTYYEQ